MNSSDSDDSGARLDSWLWAARFYKTRPLAVAAIKNGRVLVNGMRAKPARTLAVHDRISIRKDENFHMEVIVLALTSKRVSAKLAQALYQETPESVAGREHWQAQRQLARDLVHFPEHKPDKRERRQLRAIRHRDDH